MLFFIFISTGRLSRWPCHFEPLDSYKGNPDLWIKNIGDFLVFAHQAIVMDHALKK